MNSRDRAEFERIQSALGMMDRKIDQLKEELNDKDMVLAMMVEELKGLEDLVIQAASHVLCDCLSDTCPKFKLRARARTIQGHRHAANSSADCDHNWYWLRAGYRQSGGKQKCSRCSLIRDFGMRAL